MNQKRAKECQSVLCKFCSIVCFSLFAETVQVGKYPGIPRESCLYSSDIIENNIKQISKMNISKTAKKDKIRFKKVYLQIYLSDN